ncbi:MAG: HAD-IA family hydrolase [Alteromonadaceae bacterium]|nr:HAD-IA family hydrolase [Alteromonadaceae bacterium]
MDKYKLIIFDWDGTLMDSVERIISSMQAAAKIALLNIPTNEQTKQIIGLSMLKGVELLFPERTKAQETLVIEEYRRQYIELNDIPTTMFPNALELLKALRQNKKLLAVATGKGRGGLQRVMTETQTEDYFHASRCADEALSKPDPQMLLSLLDELNVLPHEALMIGDTSHDLFMAQQAGIDSVGVTHGVHDAQVLSKYKPRALVDSLIQLEKLLLK